MSTGPTTAEIHQAVLNAYKDQYGWDVRITDVIRDTFGGDLVVTRAKLEDGSENEEISFVYPEGTVRIFRSTEELARFLEVKARAPLLERLVYRPVLTGIVFLVLLVVVIVVGFSPIPFDENAFSVLAGILAMATGFFFGSHGR